jgi:hypothetical protein
MAIGDGFDQGKAEARTPYPFLARLVDPVELLE